MKMVLLGKCSLLLRGKAKANLVQHPYIISVLKSFTACIKCSVCVCVCVCLKLQAIP